MYIYIYIYMCVCVYAFVKLGSSRLFKHVSLNNKTNYTDKICLYYLMKHIYIYIDP